MNPLPTRAKRCQSLLNAWRNDLCLTKREQTLFKGQLKTLDMQIKRLNDKSLRIGTFGRVGVGKSSLLNALLDQNIFATDVAHGCTRQTQSVDWNQAIGDLKKIQLVDTPGVDEIACEARARLAARIARQVDLVLFVLDSDISKIELEALEILLISGKPLVLVLNRCDQWQPNECKAVVQSIRNRLPLNARKLEIKAVAAAPRKPIKTLNGLVRSEPCSPRIDSLMNYLKKLLNEEGELLLALNALRQADYLHEDLKLRRLKRSKAVAQGLIGKFAALKASAVAVNPLLMLDLAGGLAFDTALIVQLSKVYGFQIQGDAARKLLRRLSLSNAFLGGAQVGIQLCLATLRQFLLFITPITGGLSLASSAPVALVQAALAVHSTKITGQLAAKMFFYGSHRRSAQPGAMLRRLSHADLSKNKAWLVNWSREGSREMNNLKALLP